jgi:REP element-mobilizing transposase RayT
LLADERAITIHVMGVMPDHVQLFVQADPTSCVAEIVNRLKGRSSRVLWQEFLAATVGAVSGPGSAEFRVGDGRTIRKSKRIGVVGTQVRSRSGGIVRCPPMQNWTRQ